MPLEREFTEAWLIHMFRSCADAAERALIIGRYAKMKRLSPGKAEDALDVLVYMLSAHLA
jgi:hypothetical protein